MAIYYFSSTGSDSNNGTSTSTPMKTITKAEALLNGVLNPGDSILFKRGDTFTGKLIAGRIWGYNAKNGTSIAPITIGAYGSGNKPKFLYPTGGSASAENRILMRFNGLSYYTIENLEFTDADTSNNHVTPANCGFPIYLGAEGEADTDHFTIQDVDISLCGMGIVLYGNNNLVTRCNMSNFKNLKSTTGGVEDYGANAITIQGNDNVISHCYLANAWSESKDFGYNGGAVEMYGYCNRNQFLYNTVEDCGGISEFGSSNNGTSYDNLYAYNKVINCGGLAYCNISGSFATQVGNTMFYNNTIVETTASRFTGATVANGGNAGAGITTPEALSHYSPDNYLFSFNGSPTAQYVYVLKNNVFQLSSGVKLCSSGGNSKILHQNNIYKVTAPSSVGVGLGSGESITTGTIFTSTSGSNPALWDFRPANSSVLINAGVAIAGQTVDIEGNAISGLPDVGAYEKVGTAAPLNVFAVATAITCNGGSSTVTVTATGGTGPYTGTGTFTKTAGTYTFTVTDSAAGSGSATISIGQPAVVTATMIPEQADVYGGTGTITVTNVAGGTAPYTYNLDGGAYQSGDQFLNVTGGSHTVNIKDANACIKAFTVVVDQPVNSTLGIYLVSKKDVTKRSGFFFSKSMGAATVRGSGGTIPYKYNIDNGSFKSTTGIFSNLSAGIHKFGVKDATGTISYITVKIFDCSKNGPCV